MKNHIEFEKERDNKGNKKSQIDIQNRQSQFQSKCSFSEFKKKKKIIQRMLKNHGNERKLIAFCNKECTLSSQ